MIPGCKQSPLLVRPARLGISANRPGAMRAGPIRREPVKPAELAAKKRPPRWKSKLKLSPREEYRQREAIRVEASASLSQRYPRLRALTVELTYFDREIVSWGQGIKYRANLKNARSVLCFQCPSALCIGGAFDLSEPLAGAVGLRQTKLAGDLRCKGFRRQVTGELVPCEAALHYKLTAAYQRRGHGVRSSK